MYQHRILFHIPNPFGGKSYGSGRLAALHLTTNEIGWNPSRLQWSLKLHLGRGAGYIWGRTLYLTWRCRQKEHTPSPSIGKLAFGLTQNANKIPYVSG